MAVFGFPIAAGFSAAGEAGSCADHSWLSKTRSRLPHEVLAQIVEAGLVKGERIGVDASTLEANAALRNIVRRDTAARAFDCCIVEWLNRHPQHSDPGRCAWCGKPDRHGHAVVPFGTKNYGPTWLHPEC